MEFRWESHIMSAVGLLMLLLLGLASCQGTAEEPEATSTPPSRPGATSTVSSPTDSNASVTGTVTYRERLALTGEASLVVELRDVSYADAAAPLIASQTIHNPGQVPITFEVPYNRADIDRRKVYSITARIIESGRPAGLHKRYGVRSDHQGKSRQGGYAAGPGTAPSAAAGGI